MLTQKVVPLLLAILLCFSVSRAHAGKIELKNDCFVLRFNDQTGALVEVETSKGIRLFGGEQAPVDIFAGGKWRLGSSALSLNSHRVENKDGGKVLTMDCSVADWEVQITYYIPARGSYIRRRVKWHYMGNVPTSVVRLRFNIPGACIDSNQDCFYTIPSLWPPDDIPFTRLNKGQRRDAHIWNAVPPAVVIYNNKHQLGFCATFFTEDECYMLSAIEGKNSVDIYTEVSLECTVQNGDVISLGDEIIYLTEGTMLDAISATGKAWEIAGFRLAKSSDWTYGTSLYSLWAGGSDVSGHRDLGGLKNFQKYLLPRLNKLGLGTIWFNPIYPGVYGPSDYFTVDRVNGTLDDLKNVCDDAHNREMRIWLDLIPHGPLPNSKVGRDILKEHPEWISRDQQGKIKLWWGCYSCDYAHPGWQAFMADVATFYIKRCGIDGWRVDCAGGGPANFSPYGNFRPSQSGLYGSLRLLEKVRKEMQFVKPDSALLGEVGSILHLSQCEFIYDWDFHNICRLVPTMPIEKWISFARTGLERQGNSLPKGAQNGLMRFLENHDLHKSVGMYGVGHEKALLSVCSLIPGLVFIFNEQDIGFGKHFEKLLRIRKSFEEFQNGRAIYSNTKSSVPTVFAFTRVLDNKFSVVAINFSSIEQNADIRVPMNQLGNIQKNVIYAAGDVYDNIDLGTKPISDWQQLSLNLEPYGTRVVVFRQIDQPEPILAKKREEPLYIAQKPLSISQSDTHIVAVNAFYRIEFENGLIKSLSNYSGETLLTFMNIVEDERRRSGRRLNFLDSIKTVESVITEKEGKKVVIFKGVIEHDTVSILWESRYTLNDSPEIGVEFCMSPNFEGTFCGQLGIDLVFGKTNEWLVNTLEGQLHDYFFVTHPRGDMFTNWKLWHRSGFLWEASLFPLDREYPIVATEVSGTWLSVILPSFSEEFENAYLRERSSNVKENLVLHLAWFDEKDRFDLARPVRGTFKLVIGSEPHKSTGTISGKDWVFNSESSRYRFCNSHYELAFSRLGGNIFHFASPGGEPVIEFTEVYSEQGIHTPTEGDARGSSKNDFEPDIFLTRTGNSLNITLSSFFRRIPMTWNNVMNPRVQYELSYFLSDSSQIQVKCRVKPLLSKPNLSASLVYTLHIRNARRWNVDSVKGKISGDFSSREIPEGRTWESRDQPLAAGGNIEIELLDGQKLKLTGINTSEKEVQNIFIFDNGKNTAKVFFAFMDDIPENYKPAWRTIEYAMELLKP